MIRLTNISGGYELTEDVSGLQFSNVRPGGDEAASFVFRRKWRTDSAEIKKGSTVVIRDGVDVLWQGRIEEHERGGDRDEQIAVTCYGLGIRLKDGSMQEIYLDRDLDAWGEMSLQRKVNLGGAGYTMTHVQISKGFEDTGTTGPGIVFEVDLGTAGTHLGEQWYYGGGVDLGQIRYHFYGTGFDSAWSDAAILSSNDVHSSYDAVDEDSMTGTNETVNSTVDGRKYGTLQVAFGTGGGLGVFLHSFRHIRVMGRRPYTTMTGRGSQAAATDGFYSSDVVADVIARLTGMRMRRNDQTTYVIRQIAFKDLVPHEAVISEVWKYDGYQRTWGTWGPGGPLEELDVGNFDYRAVQGASAFTEVTYSTGYGGLGDVYDGPSRTETVVSGSYDDGWWEVPREDAENLRLANEISAAFNKVVVNYQTTDGLKRVVTRAAPVDELDFEKVKPIEGGVMTTEGAETLADAHLSLFGGFVPARGSFSLSTPVKHTVRGTVAPWFMRADGSVVNLRGVLPSSRLFSLNTGAERRSQFPIKRVSVDCSNPVPRVSVDVDQTSEAMETLANRLGLARELAGV